ncbi:Gfo/Idh/MocA family protein [Azospira restricta]|uniref:Gfo/Idh/MocA family oxidoreductase n=1 Tax=Azospira restricta TaxID=404405 RepID=A0A974SPG3_9RHOO|nr:Gfo/Idh/MocA family oxidoreductase [Azospira restricta]QRJ64051.1 Gfo/Idh/MocA family oxidoreductase [Azospira restricta]
MVVSLGSIGRRHLKNLRSLRPQAQIGVLRLTAAQRGETLPGADRQFTDIDEALAFAPAAAIVCSPATTHVRVASALVDRGIPVLIEKPIAGDLAGLDDLLALAIRRGVPLMTAYNLRFLPSLREVRQIVESGAIGEVLGVRAEVGQYLPDWRPGCRYQDSVSARRDLGGGALLELSHEIDYVYWMFGMPSRVAAMGGCYGELGIEVEDMASLCLEYDRPRRLVNIHLDFLQRSVSRTCKFIGSQGTLVWNGMTDVLELYRPDSGAWSRAEVPAVPDRNAMYLDELSHFLECVEQRQAPLIDGHQGRDVLRIVEAAKESIRRRSTVEIGNDGVA